MGEKVARILVEEQVTFARPADVGGKGEAVDFGKGSGLQQADVVIGERGEEFAVAGGSKAV